MSVSRDEWNKGKVKDALETRVLQLFLRDKGKAWGRDGIDKEVFGSKTDEKVTIPGIGRIVREFFTLDRILTKLTKEGKIEAREVQMRDGSLETYYALKEDI